MTATLEENVKLINERRKAKEKGELLADDKRIWCHPPKEHLIFAFMVENTFIYEIFAQIIKEFIQGEKLGFLDDASARNTIYQLERDIYTSHTSSLVSDLRPDERANRRNAYYRMFGMDLSHGNAEGKPYPYVKSENANTQFVTVLEMFLQELWVGHVNFNNHSGIKLTDISKISELFDRLRSMLKLRKSFSTLEQEEVRYVKSMYQLFTIVESDNSDMIKLLRCQAGSTAGRLQKLAEKVNLKSNPRSVNYFKLATSMSTLCELLETSPNAENFDMNSFLTENSELNKLILTIITHWSEATGRDLKAMAISTSQNPTTPRSRITAVDNFVSVQ